MAGKRRKDDALERGLKSMFRALQARPLPDRLKAVVDQIHEGDAPQIRREGRA